MKNTAYRSIGILMVITLFIYIPVAWSHFFYTDDITQLWFYRKGSAFHMFNEQGRYLTDLLSAFLFSSIDTIAQIKWLHLFSLAGWLLCLPIWYLILDKITRKEGLSPILPFFAVLYLVTSMPVMTSIVWATMMELFIANTAGLIAGFIVYSYRSVWSYLLALAFSLISLFSYQSCFGCFLLPFLLQLIARRTVTRPILLAIGFYFLSFLAYDALFHWQLSAWKIPISNRAGLATNPGFKLLWFVGMALASSFHFNWVVNEHDMLGRVVYGVILLAYVGAELLPGRSSAGASPPSPPSPSSLPSPPFPRVAQLRHRILYLLLVFLCLIIIYLPNMAVKESFSSNRTRTALNLAVFLLVFTTLIKVIKKDSLRRRTTTAIAMILVFLAAYNIHFVFLNPITKEYTSVRAYVEKHYHPGITTVTFIRPPGDLFKRKYGINSSWDEFGFPTTYPNWVPDPFIRQIIFEKTGSRAIADSLTIISPDNSPVDTHSVADPVTPSGTRSATPSGTLLVDVEDILK